MLASRFLALAIAASGLLFCGCSTKRVYNSSVVNFLYYGQENICVKPSMPYIDLPMRVGIAFLPDRFSCTRLSEQDRARLICMVKDELSCYDFVGGIQVIPTVYLHPHGGFKNLCCLASQFNIDVIILLSYDHHRYCSDCISYRTIEGLYNIPGNPLSVFSMVDATAYHIPTQKLLFMAPGVSCLEVCSTCEDDETDLFMDSGLGYDQAVCKMIANLRLQLGCFLNRMYHPEEYANP